MGIPCVGIPIPTTETSMNITWILLNDMELATLPDGTKLRIRMADVGVGSMGKGQNLSFLSTEKGWQTIDFQWFKTDGGYHSWQEKGYTLYKNQDAATKAVKAMAEYLYAEQFAAAS